MKNDNAIFFEYKAKTIEKDDIDEEVVKSEVERTLKYCFLNGLKENFDKIPFKVTIESRINENSKMETEYKMNLVILNQDTFEELIERQEKLELLLSKKAVSNKRRMKDNDDDWLSNKRIN